MRPHEEWLFKAGQDLQSARLLSTAHPPLSDIAIYHTQQCAEKALKALLAFKMQEPVKTHDLRTLVEKCISLDSSFELLYDQCIYLNPFSTLYRYPDGNYLPDKKTLHRACETAQAIFNFVKSIVDAAGDRT